MTTVLPKVSIICTCFNHEHYVVESLQSVLSQSYKNYELIVIDDGSSDRSAAVIENFQRQHPQFTFIRLERNEGICKAFNTGFNVSNGDFIIDLAADDVLLPDRVERGVELFKTLDNNYGVIFADAEWIDAHGNRLFLHSQKYPHDTIPQGDIYKDLIERYFICSPTIMFRKSVIDTLGGYDETLTYEDFDFWIRSSRIYKYRYQRDVLVKKRKLKNSLSHNQFKILNKHSYSTYNVCCKILELNRTDVERDALRRRIQYEIRQSIKTLDASLAYKYFLLWLKNNSRRF
ncbi:MAG TPA: glycosyltransferase [Chryseolinea sp.]|nr:glycosyltransferase [Chryseolinea sp.]